MRKSLERWSSWVGFAYAAQIGVLAGLVGRTGGFDVLDLAAYLVVQVLIFGGCAFRAGVLYQREAQAATEPEPS